MTHRLPIRVYYEDTDMAGIVYYANYLRYIERARSDWVREIGIDQLEMKASGVVFAVRRIEADYIAPAVFDDLLEVRTWPTSISPARLVMTQEVCRGETVCHDCVYQCRRKTVPIASETSLNRRLGSGLMP